MFRRSVIFLHLLLTGSVLKSIMPVFLKRMIMLKYFEVDNFRGFDEPVGMDFHAGSYAFNSDIVCGDYVKNAIIYGRNGIGKSALGIAMFDVVAHLTDYETIHGRYLRPYCNLNTGRDVASFKFVFDFEGDEVEYTYAKRGPDDLAWEKLYVSGRCLIKYDYAEGGVRYVDEKAVGQLQIDLPDNRLSVLKYIYRNLPTNTVPAVTRLVDFCKGMLWYRSLSDGNDYAGFQTGSGKLDETIFKSGRLMEFEAFLKENGVDYNLSFEEREGLHVLMVEFASGRKVPFDAVASTGTKALRLFFYWRVSAFDRVTFLFIDEFDAFLHFESAADVVRVLNAIPSCQTVVTSHNTYLMQNDLTRPDCCYVMTKNKVVPLCKATMRILREGHNLGKMYVNGAFVVA